MVGVAGKSKACHSCKKRRITCGLQRPQCSQCIKANLVCSGYQRDRIFIHTGTTKWTQKSPAKSNASKVRDGGEQQTSSQSTDLQRVISLRSKRALIVEPNPCQLITPQAAYRQQLFSAFLCQLAPKMHSEFSEERSWLTVVPEISSPTKALEISTTALCMVGLGRSNEDLVLVQQSLSFYAQALHEMQKALWDPHLMYQDDTLGACMALAMYELLGCPDASKRAYANHQDGLAKLVELRGPEAHKSGFGHQMFVAFRIQNILFALERHRSTFLSSQTWLSEPWEIKPKSPIDQIFDLFSLAPGIFEQGDKLGGLPAHEALHEMLRMVNRCWKIDADLEKFFSELKSSTLGPLYWPELARGLSSVEDDELGPVFPVAFHFVNLKMSYTMMFYWATALILWSGLCQLYQGIHGLDLDCRGLECFCLSCDRKACSETDNHLHKFDITRLPPLDHRVDFSSLARNICQSVEYCLQETMGQYGAFSAAAPLAIALENLKNLPGCSREAAWAKVAMTKIIGRGLKILEY